jgi:GT2 family glycosyltransferase
MGQRIAAVIPTFNEVEHLTACVESLESQNDPELEIIVANAGQALPDLLASRVTELKLASDSFWTASIHAGVQQALASQVDYVLFTNADTTFLPDALRALKQIAGPKTIACSPAYEQIGDAPIRLLYSDQDEVGKLLFGKLIRRWSGVEDAPSEPIPIQLTGGQGVLMPASLFQEAKMDFERFPHYTSDHDLWLQARKLGYELVLAPNAGIVNRRELQKSRDQKRRSLPAYLWKRLWSEYTPDSWTILWRLRRKHQGPIVGFFTTFANFAIRWTAGLPKILRGR